MFDFFGPSARKKAWSDDPLALRCAVLIGTGIIWCTAAWVLLR